MYTQKSLSSHCCQGSLFLFFHFFNSIFTLDTLPASPISKRDYYSWEVKPQSISFFFPPLGAELNLLLEMSGDGVVSGWGSERTRTRSERERVPELTGSRCTFTHPSDPGFVVARRIFTCSADVSGIVEKLPPGKRLSTAATASSLLALSWFGVCLTTVLSPASSSEELF